MLGFFESENNVNWYTTRNCWYKIHGFVSADIFMLTFYFKLLIFYWIQNTTIKCFNVFFCKISDFYKFLYIRKIVFVVLFEVAGKLLSFWVWKRFDGFFLTRWNCIYQKFNWKRLIFINKKHWSATILYFRPENISNSFCHHLSDAYILFCWNMKWILHQKIT